MAQTAILSPATRDLERAVEAGSVVRALERVGLTQRMLAWATGASERSVRNWRSTSAIRPRYDERLREIRDIVLLLDETLTPRGIAQWFGARNRLLSGRKPIDVLHDGDFETVRAAAASFVEGAYL